LHLDLIIGLPGESIEGFAKNLNTLVSITNAEIQLGILKKLSGAPILRWDKVFDMKYCHIPPYEILQNSYIDFEKMQEMKRFARYWNMIYNSGNFEISKRLIYKNETVFDGFLKFCRFLFDKTNMSFGISLDRLMKLLFEYLISQGIKKEEVANALLKDFLKIKGRNIPNYLKESASIDIQVIQSKIDKAHKRQILRASANVDKR